MPTVGSMRVLERPLQVVGTVLRRAWAGRRMRRRQCFRAYEDIGESTERADVGPRNAIPSNVLQGAKCIAVIPSMVQVAVALGGNHGKGFVTCRPHERVERASADRPHRGQLGPPDRRRGRRPSDGCNHGPGNANTSRSFLEEVRTYAAQANHQS
jgi:hypothetical protein